MAIVVPPRPLLLSVGAYVDSVSMARAYIARQYGVISSVMPGQGYEVATIEYVRLGEVPPQAEGVGFPLLREVPSSTDYDVIVLADHDADDADMQGATHTRLGPWLAASHAAGALIVASGAGIALLAESGLLSGRAATGPWWLAEKLRRKFPRARFTFGQPVVEDNGVMTTAGARVDPQAGVEIVERIASRNTALWLSRRLLPQGNLEQPSNEEDPLLARAQQWLSEHFSRPVNVGDLASSLGVSRRTLVRHFSERTGTSPLAYVQMLRVEAAKRMLERSPFRIDRIAGLVGYSDAGFFRATFRRLAGMSPREWRRRHGGNAEGPDQSASQG